MSDIDDIMRRRLEVGAELAKDRIIADRRDKFAGQALMGIMARNENPAYECSAGTYAKQAYKLADAMLKERKKWELVTDGDLVEEKIKKAVSKMKATYEKAFKDLHTQFVMRDKSFRTYWPIQQGDDK